MVNKFRLTSNAFEREKEEERINPTKTIFLSLEGTDTEKEYIYGLKKNKIQLGFNTNIQIETLNRQKRDGCTAPEQVIELLEEYLLLRNESIDSQIKDILDNDYTEDTINDYIYNPNNLSHDLIEEINAKLSNIGYDLNYKKYLKNMSDSNDLFGIVIDRDNWCNLEYGINHCKDKGYLIFLSNPCFELWLLLHWEDVSLFSKEMLDEIKINRKVSNKHTYTSCLLSKVAHHNKTSISFDAKYLDKVDNAIKNAKKLETNLDNLLENIGSNFVDLLTLLKTN